MTWKKSNGTEPRESSVEEPTRPRKPGELVSNGTGTTTGRLVTAVYPPTTQFSFPAKPCVPRKPAVFDDSPCVLTKEEIGIAEAHSRFDGAGTDSNNVKEKDYLSTLDRVRVPLTKFEQELRKLINSQSMENASNTPDLILAEYLSSCLNAFNLAVAQREKWYGRKVF